MSASGLVHLYYGDGKGKTTAAMGLAVRAFGAGFDVLVVQFLKDGSSSELAVLRDRLGIPVLAEQITSRMSNKMTDEEKEKTLACHGRIWQKAMDWVGKSQSSIDIRQPFSDIGEPSTDIREPFSGRILILDEILGAIEAELFPEEKVLAFLDQRPSDLEVVLTGRSPSLAFMERADYRSQIVCAGHPYNMGIAARKGIEF